jgi:hypothetical protein
MAKTGGWGAGFLKEPSLSSSVEGRKERRSTAEVVFSQARQGPNEQTSLGIFKEGIWAGL